MKILLIGLGSIGKRHLRNILSLGNHDVTIVSRSGSLPGEFEQFKVFASLQKALAESDFETAFICTPTSKHIEALKPVLRAGIPNIFIEKPISHSLAEVDELFESTLNKNIVIGFDLHFDPGFMKVKELLKNNVIGTIVSVNAQVGQYLPDWRPGEDYRHGMSAKKETGGGVMLDLIHEFDYLYSFCGKAKTIASLNKNSGALQIETEDVAEVLLQFESGCIGTIHLDYLQQKLVRNCLITGAAGTIIWDLGERTVSWIDLNKKETTYSYTDYERNDRFVAIVKAFLLGKKDERLTSFSQGLESLKMVIAAKKSSEEHQFISMDTIKSLPVC